MLKYEVLELEFCWLVRVWNTTHTEYFQRGFRKSRWSWLNRRRLRKKKEELELLLCVEGSRMWAKEYCEIGLSSNGMEAL
jgi:hypothetical protein